MTVPSLPIHGLAKTQTGIKGFDEATYGGLPRGRVTLVCGDAGSGKSLFGVEFLVRGILEHHEPGVLLSFEETEDQIAKNVASLGFDLDSLRDQGLLAMDFVYVERSEIEETGEFDLDGLFVRLAIAIESVGAKRVVLDTIEALFTGFDNEAILRAELRRLFRWLKDRGVTTVITGERGEGALTRYGLEEYVSDCVILLDHRIENQVATRRLRIVKYRGSLHGTNEYPFIIGASGISVLPITSVGLNHEASVERVSSGVTELDRMLEGKGFYRGSSILVTGAAGTGKSSLSACFIDAACRRGEKALLFSFEESPSQFARNMRPIGIDLSKWVANGTLEFHATRPTLFGLETHLAMVHQTIETTRPDVVVFDPVTNLINVGSDAEVRAMLTRLIDHLKTNGITAVFTSLIEGESPMAASQIGISSLMDTWISLFFHEGNGERNRGLLIVKSRGMGHSNQIREFLFTKDGLQLVDVYLGPSGVEMGAARKTQSLREEAESLRARQEIEAIRRKRDRQRAIVEARIALLQAEMEAAEEESTGVLTHAEQAERRITTERSAMSRIRHTGGTTDELIRTEGNPDKGTYE